MEDRKLNKIDTDDEPVICLNHYSSDHQILLVGEGDFSFSLTLAHSFNSASNIVATSLDSKETVLKSYRKAKSNLENLEKLGALLLHGVDATRMKLHTDLKMRKFDRIIFNFPHAGFHGKEDQMHIIKLHRNLVQRFLENASHMLRPDGEIHVSHKTAGPFREWNLEDLASNHSLALIERVDFKKKDYPGYNNKRGAGKRPDEPFPLGKCCTFKFINVDTRKKKRTPKQSKNFYLDRRSLYEERAQRQLLDSAVPTANDLRSVSYPQTKQSENFYLDGRSLYEERAQRQLLDSAVPTANDLLSVSYRQTKHDMQSVSSYYSPVVLDRIKRERLRIFEAYFRHAQATFGRLDDNYGQRIQDLLRVAYENYKNEEPGRDSYGYIRCLQELHRLSILRSAWLQRRLLGSVTSTTEFV